MSCLWGGMGQRVLFSHNAVEDSGGPNVPVYNSQEWTENDHISFNHRPLYGFRNIHLKACAAWNYSDLAVDVMFLPEWEEKVSKGLKEVCVGSGWWLFIITLKCGSVPL